MTTAAPERERLVEADRVELARQRRVAGEQRLHLAREEQPPGVLAPVQGPHADAIAGEHERLVFRAPQRDG